MNGICTLANDYVYDQLIALLNSIEVMMGKDFPVCVYPYDNCVEKIAEEINRRPNVSLYDDRASIERWDDFSRKAWDAHPTAFERWNVTPDNRYHRFGTHRRYCAFDAPFDRFFYMDADTLLLNSAVPFFEKLDQFDCVVYDYQFKDISHVYEKNNPKLTQVFSPERLQSEIFCSGAFASKKGLFDDARRKWLLEQLEAGDAEILYPMAPDQTLVNYMMMKSSLRFYNFALHVPKEERFGNCVTSLHFVEKDHLLYDKDYRINYLHYIGLSSRLFTRACAGENIDFPYRDLFLHYRFLYEPEQRPQFTTPPRWYTEEKAPQPSLKQRILGKLKRLTRNAY